MAAKKAKLFEAESERSSLNTAHSTQMPNYELIAKFYTEHSSAQARSSSLQPCDFRNQIYLHKRAQNPQPSCISCTASPTAHLSGLLNMRVAGEFKKQLAGLVCSCGL